MKKYLLFLACLIALYGYAQNTPVTDTLKINIDTAFKQYEDKTQEFIERDLLDSLKTEYYAVASTLRADGFYDKHHAENLIRYYKTTPGITEIIEEFLKGADQFERIFSIGTELYMKIYFRTKEDGLNLSMGPGTPNKYARLLVAVQPANQNAVIYLNGNKNCTVAQAAKGLRVHSGKRYRVEIKLGTNTLCTYDINLNGQEAMNVSCP